MITYCKFPWSETPLKHSECVEKYRTHDAVTHLFRWKLRWQQSQDLKIFMTGWWNWVDGYTDIHNTRMRVRNRGTRVDSMKQLNKKWWMDVHRQIKIQPVSQAVSLQTDNQTNRTWAGNKKTDRKTEVCSSYTSISVAPANTTLCLQFQYLKATRH